MQASTAVRMTRAGLVVAWVTTAVPLRAQMAALERADVAVEILPTAAP